MTLGGELGGRIMARRTAQPLGGTRTETGCCAKGRAHSGGRQGQTGGNAGQRGPGSRQKTGQKPPPCDAARMMPCAARRLWAGGGWERGRSRLSRKRRDSLLDSTDLSSSRRDGAQVRGPRVGGSHGRQALTSRSVNGGVTRRRASGGHRLGGKIAVMQALGTVLARRPAVLVDALGLALATAYAGAARPQGGAADHTGRHGLFAFE